MAGTSVVRKALIALVVVIVVALLVGFFWLHSLASYLVASEAPTHADIILVLGGDWTGQRILTAAELAKQGYAPRVWVSGPMELYGVNEAKLAIDFAAAHGYPRSLFEEHVVRAQSTREEAKLLKKEFEKANVHRILLVTSNFHTHRAGGIYRKTLGPGYELHVVSAPYAYFHENDWWKHREDQKTVFFEWTKTIAEELGL